MAALRHLLRPLKQISSLSYARAGTPRPPAALGLQPRTFTSGTNQAQAKKYTTSLQDLDAFLGQGFGMQYYRHGKMVSVESDRIPGLMDNQSFRRLLLGIDVFCIGIPWSFALYLIMQD